MNITHFAGTPWGSFLSLMSPMIKAFWRQGLTHALQNCVLGIDWKNLYHRNWWKGWFLRHSLTITRDWLDQLTTHAYTAAPDIVLCGNKVLSTSHPKYGLWLWHYHLPDTKTMSFLFQVDLEGLRTVSSDRGRAMAAELGLPYFETSAATGQGCIKSRP